MLPSYQEILKNSYIHKIIKQLLKNNPLEIVEIENKYYIKDTNENLIFIQENMGRSYIVLKRILNSCIYCSSNSNNEERWNNLQYYACKPADASEFG